MIWFCPKSFSNFTSFRCQRVFNDVSCVICLSGMREPHVAIVNRALSEVFHAEPYNLRNVKTVQRETVAIRCRVVQNRATLFFPIVRDSHVSFVDRALPEVSQAELDGQRNVKAAPSKAVAIRRGVIQNRARLFFIAPTRCPCREVRHNWSRRSLISELSLGSCRDCLYRVGPREINSFYSLIQI